MERQPEILAKAILLADECDIEELPARAWRLVVRSGPHPGLHQVLERYARRDRLSRVDPDSSSRERVSRWCQAGTIPRGLIEDREESPARSFREWAGTLPSLSTPIEEGSPLWAAVKAELLVSGNVVSLLAESPGQLITFADELGAVIGEGFAINYIARLRPERRWSETVVEWVLRRHGNPKPAAPSGMWRRLEDRSRGAVADIANWLALKVLKEFFASIDDDLGRFDFWNTNFGKELLGAQLLTKDAAVLQLPGLAIVEFGRLGYAAYVYSERDLDWLLSRHSDNPRDYQDQNRLVRMPRGGGEPLRIIHDGRGRWRMETPAKIRLLIGRSGR